MAKLEVNNPEPVQLQSFILFTKLPLELRTMIWKYANTTAARRIEILKGVYHVWDLQFRTPRPPPSPLLHVSRESALIAQEFYKPAFSTLFKAPQYFNFGTDAIHARGFKFTKVLIHGLKVEKRFRTTTALGSV
jgi:2EXR family